MSATLDFDTGPLNWVRGDIEAALKSAAERVRAYGTDQSLENALRLARDEAHGATGALRMVGLEGAAKVIASLEDALTAMDSKDIAADELNTKAVLDALDTLLKWVVRMAEGRGEGELALFPTYRRLRELTGAEKIFEGELFYPNLKVRVETETQAGISDDELPQRVKAARAQFQRGLLAFLRSTKAEAGLAAMAKALAEVESCVSSQAARAFWWACKGFVDALLNKGVEPDFHVKQLLARIDLQMRQLIEGSPQVAEHLMRDALFFIAKSKSMGNDSEAVRSAFGLDKYLPKQQMDAEQMARARPVLKLLKETLTESRNLWNSHSEGKQESLGAFQAAVARLSTQAGALGVPVLGELISAVTETTTTEAAGGLSGDVLAAAQLEIATTLLFLQNAVDSEDILAPDFQSRAQNQMRRLAAARAGQAEGSASDLMDEGSLKAAEHALLAQLGQEIRSSLQQMEESLDAFFRDPEARDGLSSLDMLSAQVQGALAILEQSEAIQLLQSAMGAVRPYVISGTPDDAEKTRIADALSSLGLFIEAHCAGREDAKRILQHPMVAFGLAGPEPDTKEDDDFFVSEAAAPAASEAELDPIELAIAAAVNEPAPAVSAAFELQPLEWQPLEVGGTAPAPEETIESTATAADEIDESLLGLESHAERQEAPVAEISAESIETPAASPAAPEIDPELLEIFLEEAGEVLNNMAASADACEDDADDRENLTVVRRAFHTLKGSGRMVGLMDLGEVAWEIEQVMNRWLEQQRPATPTLLELIEKASAAFAAWVEKLRDGSLTGEIDAAGIVELARRLKSGEVTEPPPQSAAPAEPDAVQIGSVRLSRSMFEIFIQEALGHVALLQQECERWKANRGEDTPHEFLRAAHTLASSARTAGFEEVANLAGAVEHWVPFARLVTDPEDALPVQAAIEALKQMVDAVAAQEAPAQGVDITQALQGLTERLQSAAPAEPPAQPSMAIDLDAIDLDLTRVESKVAVPEEKIEEKREEAAPLAVPPAVPAAVPSGRELRKMHDDIDEQLLPIFIEEAQTLLPQIGSDIRDLKANPSDVNIVQSLQRGLHTLKGSARMAGAIRLGELTHIMESLVESALEKNRWDADLFAELEEKMDRLSLDLERMQGKPEPAPAVVAPVVEEHVLAEKPEAKPQPRPAPRAEPPLPSPAAMLRVNADTLDHLINEAGEVSIARSRIEAELRSVKQTLGDLTESISRLRNQLREVEVQADSQMQSRKSELEEKKTEFDPLEFDRYTRLQELTRLMSESLHDITSIQQTLVKSLGETDAAVLAQARTSRDVQQELMRMRAVPFSNLNERLYRIVRQTARDLEKKAELEIEGSQVELDRGVLDKISAPLEHMLRNSLAHGLEAPAKRLADGKPETGRISITLRQESNEIALVLSDDGAGIDTGKLYHKALERGIVTADAPLTDAEKMHLIFASGLSTAEKVTELSGRGVGMDVVRNDITSIGGRVDIASTRGKGTTFTIYLPLTLAVTQAVMVRAGQTTLAISAAMVENVLRLKSDAMASLYERRTVEIGDRSYPLHYLQQLIGVSGATEIQPYNSVLLLRSGIQRIALHVDELIGNQEIVVKSVGPQLLRVPGVAGATVLPDGGIVLIMNPVQLAQRARLQPPRPTTEALAGAAEIKGGMAPVVMVVDDSLTVRKITSRLLEREGYQVITAKDGVDALQQLKDNMPAVMLVDIEMPRMDGFDLTKNVRADPRLARIPIVIISSRTADKHRNQAAQLGVNAFLGKPYQEAELLQHIATFVGASSPDIRLH